MQGTQREQLSYKTIGHMSQHIPGLPQVLGESWRSLSNILCINVGLFHLLVRVLKPGKIRGVEPDRSDSGHADISINFQEAC